MKKYKKFGAIKNVKIIKKTSKIKIWHNDLITLRNYCFINFYIKFDIVNKLYNNYPFCLSNKNRNNIEKKL